MNLATQSTVRDHGGRRFRVLLAVFVVLGFAARLAVGVRTGLDAPPDPSGDDREYDSYAWNVVQGHGYSGISPDVKDANGKLLEHPTAYRVPGTSLFWAAIYRVVGHRYIAVRIGQYFLDSVTIYLISRIAVICFGEAVSLLAALVYAVWPTALLYSNHLGAEPLYAFLFCCFILAALKFAERPRWGLAIVAGIVLGIAMLTRGNAAMMVALVFPWSLWQFRSIPRQLIQSLAIPLISIAMLIPWAVRNYIVLHSFVPFETGSGDVVLGSNNRVVDRNPRYYGYWVYPTSELPEYTARIIAPNDEVVRDHVELRMAIEWLRDHPDRWWHLLESRFRRSLTPFLEHDSPPLYRLGMLISWGPVLVLFAVAFFPTATELLHQNHPGWIIHLGILHFLLTALVFWGASRFRFPVEGLCIILASASLVWLRRHGRNSIVTPLAAYLSRSWRGVL
jgi:4-amino-4-deoxy-L-arabinose transferase-like glycosyltransferase